MEKLLKTVGEVIPQHASQMGQWMLIGAALILALQIVSGWRQGPIRQMNRLVAVVLAYLVAYFGGRMLAPLIRGHFNYPDFVVSILAGAALGVVTFFVLIALGRIIFRATADQKSGLVRLGYGLSGAVMGMLFGIFMLWLLAIGVKVLGTVAEAQMPASFAKPDETNRPSVRFPGEQPRLPSASAPVEIARDSRPGQPTVLVRALVDLKRSLAGSVPGSMLASADPIPSEAYDVLGKIAHVVSNQQFMERFLEFPGAKALADHPNFLRLRNDPGVTELVRRKNYLALLHNPSVVQALNDPQFGEELRNFQLSHALNYALEKK